MTMARTVGGKRAVEPLHCLAPAIAGRQVTGDRFLAIALRIGFGFTKQRKQFLEAQRPICSPNIRLMTRQNRPLTKPKLEASLVVRSEIRVKRP
jgi:hypothetical protein